MDILHLIDRLEEILNESRPIPMTHSVLVDEDRILDLIDQMRVAIPEEVKKAQQVLSNRDRILAQAQEEANRTLALARERSDQLIEQDALVMDAKVRAQQVMEQNQASINAVRAEADAYAVDVLTRLEMELDRFLNQVRNGIVTMKHDGQVADPDSRD